MGLAVAHKIDKMGAQIGYVTCPDQGQTIWAYGFSPWMAGADVTDLRLHGIPRTPATGDTEHQGSHTTNVVGKTTKI
jgi:hypothetical protein